MNHEERQRAIKILVTRAARASRVYELDSYEWEAGIRQELPDLIEIVGENDFQHLICYYFGREYKKG